MCGEPIVLFNKVGAVEKNQAFCSEGLVVGMGCQTLFLCVDVFFNLVII